MQPLEFIKFTPKTNCGECGYPACLAFAAAVTKGGESPAKCPFIDLAELGPEFAGSNRGSGGMEGVAHLLGDKDMALVAYLKDKVRQLDFSSLATTLGCTYRQDQTDILTFRYLGWQVELSAQGVFFDGQSVEEPRDQILLYNYVAFQGGAKPEHTWIGMESLPNSISKIRTLRVYCEERLAASFTAIPDMLKQCVKQVDGIEIKEPEQSCSGAFIIPVLPRLPMQLLFWDEEKEDGFSAAVKILYDHKVLDFLDLESLVFASERLAERLEGLIS